MDECVREYFYQSSAEGPRSSFHRVIALHDTLAMPWEEVSTLVPTITRGWYELAHLPTLDRIEFTREFWLAKLPYHPNLVEFMIRFFAEIEDIGIFLTQKKVHDPFEPVLVYSLKEARGFFRGYAPASEEVILELQETFPAFIFPADYLAFLHIHDGFCKTTDCTGITSAEKMWESYCVFQEALHQEVVITTGNGSPVNPMTLIPFYESFGMPFFQCFWAEWYPENEMGNVYYSGITKTISDIEGKDPSSEGMAFSTFVDWLMFYMERVDTS